MAVLLCLILTRTAGAEGGGDFITAQKCFIRELFTSGRYFDAAAETRRLMALDSGAESMHDYEYFIRVNLFLGGQYRSVIQDTAHRDRLPDYQNDILLSRAYLKLGMCDRGLEMLQAVRYDSLKGPYRYNLLARRAEAYVECGLYRELLDEIDAAAPFIPEREKVAFLREEAERYRRLPVKSVPLAVALSVFIPGAGQMYAGRYLQGALSFAGVAATAAGAGCFFRRGDSALGFTFLFFSSIFYLGNIYGAYNASAVYNDDLYRGFGSTLMKSGAIPAYDPKEELRGNRIFR
jgi:hypothetical protein